MTLFYDLYTYFLTEFIYINPLATSQDITNYLLFALFIIAMLTITLYLIKNIVYIILNAMKG